MRFIYRVSAAVGLGVLISVGAAAQDPRPRNPNDWLLNAPDDTARFRLLQQELRGFSMAMIEVGERYTRLYDALADSNFEFAAYQLEKIREAIVNGYTRRPGRRPNAEKEFLSIVYQPALDTFKSRDAAKSWEAFSAVRKACMSCHEAERLTFMNNQPMFRVTERPPQR
jgi:hypothetical protein